METGCLHRGARTTGAALERFPDKDEAHGSSRRAPAQDPVSSVHGTHNAEGGRYSILAIMEQCHALAAELTIPAWYDGDDGQTALVAAWLATKRSRTPAIVTCAR